MKYYALRARTKAREYLTEEIDYATLGTVALVAASILVLNHFHKKEQASLVEAVAFAGWVAARVKKHPEQQLIWLSEDDVYHIAPLPSDEEEETAPPQSSDEEE